MVVIFPSNHLTQDVNKSGKNFQMRKNRFFSVLAHKNLIQYNLCQKKRTFNPEFFCGLPWGGGPKMHMVDYVNGSSTHAQFFPSKICNRFEDIYIFKTVADFPSKKIEHV